MKPLQCSSSDLEKCELTQELDALKPQHECQILSKEVDKTLTLGSIEILNSKISVVKENAEPLHQNQLQIIPQIHTRNMKAEFLAEISLHLRSLSYDPFYMMREGLRPVKLRLLRVNIPDQKVKDAFYRDCFKLSEVFNQREDTAIELHYTSPDIKTSSCLTKKRKRLDRHVLYDCAFKLQKSPPLKSTNEELSFLEMIGSGSNKDDSYGFVSPFTSADSFVSFRIEMDSYLASILQHSIKLSDLCCDNASWCMSHFKDMPFHIDFPAEERVLETEGNNHILEYSTPCISQPEMFEPDKSIHKDGQSSICFNETAVKFFADVNSKSSSNAVLSARNSSNYEVAANELSNNALQGSDASLGNKRGCMTENENLNQSDASCTTIINSTVGVKSKTQGPHASPKSLHMKFPENSNLPSKSELIKKFGVFGYVDYLKTKVFSFAGSARVSFLREADAVTAYFYAKRKKISFGSSNVRFWLDPFEHNREGSSKCRLPMSPSASELPMPEKSCLKSSSSEKKDRKKHKVRFNVTSKYSLPMSPSASEQPMPLKSCLKSPSSEKKDKRKRHKVRFTMVT